ncbi:hypothetical protein CTI12_AA272000 [Artemisia annua]|uniref:Uncharacterized protein n=1 Tax=Artemisia annua TaxID=35608 RepID=A0A2U1NFK4_ARTAN|nr:hypothetical protein CTI12_AA272000 [Artemisia annua]
MLYYKSVPSEGDETNFSDNCNGNARTHDKLKGFRYSFLACHSDEPPSVSKNHAYMGDRDTLLSLLE